MTDIKDIPGHDGFAIAFIILAVCIVCTVGAQAWQPYRPMIVYEPAPYKAQARVISLINHAALPWNCATIRAYANGKTREQLEQFARKYGLTAEQKREAFACLRHGSWT